MASRRSPVKSGSWQIFLSTVQLFSSGTVLGEDDQEGLVEEFEDGGSVRSRWGGWTVISSGAAGVMGCSYSESVDSQHGVAIR